MADSKLVTYERYTKKFSPSQYKKTKITIHHAAGIFKTAKEGVDYFYNLARNASANYVVANDGSIGQCVKEKDRAWTSSSTWNDCRAVTIEVSNSAVTNDWPISDKAYNALIKLMVDICKRNGINTVNYTGNKNGVLTEHNMFASTLCPGPTIHNLLASGKISQDVNAHLKDDNEESEYVLDGVDYSPVFNPTYYSSRYPDLIAAGLTTKAQLWTHFSQRGMIYEWRRGCEQFDPAVYKAQNADLIEAFDDDCFAYYRHYCMYGKDEIASGKRNAKTR